MPRRTRANFGHIRPGASGGPTVLDALERQDGKAGPRGPASMSAATPRGRRVPSSGNTPAPPAQVPVVVPASAPGLSTAPVSEPTHTEVEPATELPADVVEFWAEVEWLDDVAPHYTQGAFEARDLECLPWSASAAPVPVPVVEPAPVSAPAAAALPVVIAPEEKRTLRLDTGYRVEDFSGVLVMVLVFHAATWIGAMVGFGTFLPLVVAIGIPTLTVWGGLALIGGLGKVSLGWVRRPIIVAFTLVNVYGSFYAWNDLLAGAGAETEMARAAHRELRAEVFAPVESGAADAERAAVAAERKCEDESSQRRGGYGARARTLCDEARDLRAAADAAKAKRDALAPYFTDAVFALAPREMWDQAALAAGVANVAAPAPEAYYEVPLLRALNDLVAGRMAAIVALVFAFCIDLAGIALGRGLHHRTH